MRVNLGMQELDFGLRQQRLLPLVLPGEDLRRQQLSNTLSEGAVDRTEQTVFRLIQFDGADHPLVLTA